MSNIANLGNFPHTIGNLDDRPNLSAAQMKDALEHDVMILWAKLAEAIPYINNNAIPLSMLVDVVNHSSTDEGVPTAKAVYDAIAAVFVGDDGTVAQQIIEDWLDDHPEATTTVQDGSVTNAKLATSFVTPGLASAYVSNTSYPAGSYVIKDNVLYTNAESVSDAVWTAAHWTSVVLANKVTSLNKEVEDINVPVDNKKYNTVKGTVSAHVSEDVFYGLSNWLDSKATKERAYYNHQTTGLAVTNTVSYVSRIYDYGIRLTQGTTYFYQDLYLYFCPIVYDDGTMELLTESTSEKMTGYFTASKDGYIYITISIVNNGDINGEPCFGKAYGLAYSEKTSERKYINDKHVASGSLDIDRICNGFWKTQYLKASGLWENDAYFDATYADGVTVLHSINSNSKIYSPIRIASGKTYYFNNLYGYFCFALYDNGSRSRFSESANVSTSGTFTASANGWAFITVSNYASEYMFADGDLPGSYVEGAFGYKDAFGKSTYVVSKDGLGDYTNLVEAINTVSLELDQTIYVGAGDWDLVDEFKEYYGSGCFDTSTQGQRASDIILKNRLHLVFSPNAIVHYEYPGSQNASAEQYYGETFSPFRSGPYGFTLENLNISVTYARYCVHDDRSTAGDAYNNKYINCTFYLDNRNNSYSTNKYYQCIGGGFGTNGNVVIEGCKFKSETGVAEVSWHNTSAADAKSRLTIKDCYFDKTVRFSWYGTSTRISTLFITNCSLGSSIIHSAESLDSTVHNTEIVAWSNEVRS